MKERPIIFSGPMVRAIREGRKTQTRQVVTKQTSECIAFNVVDLERAWVDRGFPNEARGGERTDWYLHAPVDAGPEDSDDGIVYRIRPRIWSGDRLWVKETFALAGWDGKLQDVDEVPAPYYRADWHGLRPSTLDRWRPSIHMPRWASRLTLQVTGVRVERVQEISMADCAAEGIPCPDLGPWNEDPRPDFCSLWDSINAKRGHGWGNNPWVWVVEFEVIR